MSSPARKNARTVDHNARTVNPKARTVDEYLALVPPAARVQLNALRATIRNAAPQAQESISYNIPALQLYGMLVYYAAFKNHIGFYPTSSGITAFTSELADYKISKGAIRFPIDRPLPLDLIARIVKFRVTENVARTNAR